MSFVQSIGPLLNEKRLFGILRYNVDATYRLHGISRRAHIILSIPFVLVVLFVSYSYHLLTRSLIVDPKIKHSIFKSVFKSGTLAGCIGLVASCSIYLSTIFDYIISLANNRHELNFYNELSDLDNHLTNQLYIVIDYKKCRLDLWKISFVKYIYMILLFLPVIDKGFSVQETPFTMGLYLCHIFLVVDWFSFYLCTASLYERLIWIRQSLNSIKSLKDLKLIEVEILKIYKLKGELSRLWGLKFLIIVVRDLTLTAFNVFFILWMAPISEFANIFFKTYAFFDTVRHVCKTIIVVVKCQRFSTEVF